MTEQDISSPFDHPTIYRIQIQGRLPEKATGWFSGMSVNTIISADGKVITSLVGEIQDQAALHGLLGRIRDLGLNLLLVERH